MGKVKAGRPILDLMRVVPNDDLIVKPRLLTWLEKHADDPFRPDIADWVRAELVAADRVRSASFTSSSGGKCERAQVFAFMGLPQVYDNTASLEQVFQDGTWRHLRLQAQIVAADIVPLDGLEYHLDWPAMRSKGTVDAVGVVPMDHPKKEWRGKTFGLELKGANTFVYQKMEDPEKFIQQVARYFLSGGFDLFVILMEDKNVQDYKEWVIDPNTPKMKRLLREAQQELDRLNASVDNQTIPAMLPDCKKKRGSEWQMCSFGGSETRPCPLIASWSDAETWVPKNKPLRRKTAAKAESKAVLRR